MTTSTEAVPCPHCKYPCNDEHGVNTHIGRAHNSERAEVCLRVFEMFKSSNLAPAELAHTHGLNSAQVTGIIAKGLAFPGIFRPTR